MRDLCLTIALSMVCACGGRSGPEASSTTVSKAVPEAAGAAPAATLASEPTFLVNYRPDDPTPATSRPPPPGLRDHCRGHLAMTVTHHRGARGRADIERAAHSYRRGIELCLIRAGVQDRQNARLHLSIDPSGAVGSWLDFHDRGHALVRCARRYFIEGFGQSELSLQPTEVSLELSYQAMSCPI